VAAQCTTALRHAATGFHAELPVAQAHVTAAQVCWRMLTTFTTGVASRLLLFCQGPEMQ
jgi:hypothetical protein